MPVYLYYEVNQTKAAFVRKIFLVLHVIRIRLDLRHVILIALGNLGRTCRLKLLLCLDMLEAAVLNQCHNRMEPNLHRWKHTSHSNDSVLSSIQQDGMLRPFLIKPPFSSQISLSGLGRRVVWFKTSHDMSKFHGNSSLHHLHHCITREMQWNANVGIDVTKDRATNAVFSVKMTSCLGEKTTDDGHILETAQENGHNQQRQLGWSKDKIMESLIIHVRAIFCTYIYIYILYMSFGYVRYIYHINWCRILSFNRIVLVPYNSNPYKPGYFSDMLFPTYTKGTVASPATPHCHNPTLPTKSSWNSSHLSLMAKQQQMNGSELSESKADTLPPQPLCDRPRQIRNATPLQTNFWSAVIKAAPGSSSCISMRKDTTTIHCPNHIGMLLRV